MKLSFFLSGLICAILCGCAGGYSLREEAIRSNIPKEIRSYTGGPIADPTDADVEAAIKFGAGSKDQDSLDYAYVFKHQRLGIDDIYVKVRTPLYLIASHARVQARNFRKVDDNFVRFARGIHAARLSLLQQWINTRTWDHVSQTHAVMLLRDGVRVEPLKTVPGWDYQNPFLPHDQISEEAIAKAKQVAAQVAGEPANAPQPTGKIAVADSDAVFSIEELTKPGKYEIVFRTDPVDSMYVRGDKEVRFPISFAAMR